MTIHFTKYYKVANHQMSMPYCGLDDNGKCYFTDDVEKVTCKRCLKKLKNKMKKEKEFWKMYNENWEDQSEVGIKRREDLMKVRNLYYGKENNSSSKIEPKPAFHEGKEVGNNHNPKEQSNEAVEPFGDTNINSAPADVSKEECLISMEGNQVGMSNCSIKFNKEVKKIK